MGAVKTLAATLALASAVAIVGQAASSAELADFTGVWMTDKGDGAAEIRPCGEGLCGYIYSILALPEPSKPAVDGRNEKLELRKRPLCGLQIMGSLKKVSSEAYGDGWVYDPETGKQYSVEITLKGRTLAVRGYIGTKLMGKTVEWTRAASSPPKCAPPKAT
jgi:uncharacterized protein (DUF2147 family)